MAKKKKAFNKKTLFSSKLGLKLGKKLTKRYIWSAVLYNAKQIRNTWKAVKCGATERRRRSVGPNVC